MEIHSRNLVILLLSLTSWSAVQAQAIKSFPLDDQTVYHLKVSTDKVTTLVFPHAITALESNGTTMDPKVKADLLLDYQDGEKYFSVRAMKTPIKAAVNVVSNRKVYVLEFVTDDKPFQSVRFYSAEEPTYQPLTTKGVGANHLLGLLDQAKAYPLLAEQYPEMVSQVDHVEPYTQTLYKDFNVVLNQVFRFDADDALIFHLELINLTDHPIAYVPETLSVRVGTTVYPVALSDASGSIPPGIQQGKQLVPGHSTVWLVICGTPTGGRNHLSVHNPFNFLVFRSQPSE